MKRKPANLAFKLYIINQPHLLPPSYDELIEADHLVRVVNKTIEKIDLSVILAKYKGDGTSSYYPHMLLNVLVYAYSKNIYSSRKIATALRENIHFMFKWGKPTRLSCDQ